jgi:hypothetical protein
MTSELHAELTALGRLFYSGEISEEEWALLQIHLAYCDGCQTMFVKAQQISTANAPACPPDAN